ncbi:transporter substrate-binding domain-containing protein [Methylobacterium sp. WSM2598]|uniref:transporter substrate-binding domain-containing protein n=1 Tax=Methylobacterium sp. WSM2598 TaxID=398261 RepID=UPI000361B297|nr:transporter substrate-binding domain-containing protein [Methylobacterium sp. WSM2598]
MSRLSSRLLVLLSLAAVPVPAALPARAAGLPEPVRIATEGGNPPFNYVEDGRPAGFEVDLAEALCGQARLTCRIVTHQWDGIIRGLEAGEYDAIMASLAITEKRRGRIAFSRPYYRIPSAFMARRDAPAPPLDPASLKGRAIGVAARSRELAYLEARAPGADLRVFDSVKDAGYDLRLGRLDLVLGDKRELSEILALHDGAACCRLVGDVPPGDPLLGEGVGIGLRKGDDALREALDEALAALVRDGTYDRIRAKYLPFDTK